MAARITQETVAMRSCLLTLYVPIWETLRLMRGRVNGTECWIETTPPVDTPPLSVCKPHDLRTPHPGPPMVLGGNWGTRN